MMMINMKDIISTNARNSLTGICARGFSVFVDGGSADIAVDHRGRRPAR